MADPVTMSLGALGAAMMMGIAGAGSALGIGAAGPAAVGAWKKCYAQNKAAPFMLLAFVGAPLSQTIYGMILMNQMIAAAAKGMPWQALVGVGLFGGLAVGLSALFQGRIGAAASDALAETGKGTGNYLMALGIVETVAIFVLVFIGKAISLPIAG